MSDCPECAAAAKARSKARRSCRRWALRTDTGFIGPAWFPDGPVHSFSVPWKLFTTRRVAREALAKVKGPKERGKFPEARVVRVSVTIAVEE